MTLITGANGQLGSLIIDNILTKSPSTKLAALVRSEEKGAGLKAKGVQLRIGDYLDPASLETAFQGVDTLLLISSSVLEGRLIQHKNAIEAAKKAGVKHILYTSIVNAAERQTPLAFDHADTEALILETGIPYTFFRNTFYMEYFPMFLGNALESGQWFHSTGGKALNFALRTDFAEAIANVLQNPEAHQNKTYELTSGKAYTFNELVESLSEGAGKPIDYTDLAPQEYTQALTEAGVPAESVGLAGFMASVFASGAISHTHSDLETLLGRKPQDLKDLARNVAAGQN